LITYVPDQCLYTVFQAYKGYKMNGLQWTIIIGITRKYVGPALLGAAVTWLIAHNHGPWANVVCTISEALLLVTPECK
jgi:hypothetical protein